MWLFSYPRIQITFRERPGLSEPTLSVSPYLGAVGLLALVAGLPLFQFKLMSGHDTLAYLPRTVEFVKGMAAGQLFPRWARDLGGGYGQPLFNFVPPAVLLPGGGLPRPGLRLHSGAEPGHVRAAARRRPGDVRPGRPVLARGLALGLIAVIVLLSIGNAHPQRFLEVAEAAYAPEQIARGRISVTTTEEYEPVWVRERPRAPRAQPAEIVSGEGQLLDARASPTEYAAQAHITAPARIRVNTFYFPGWTVALDGAERSVEYDNPYGLMESSLEPGDHAVRVRFGDTPVGRDAEWASVAALLALLLTPALGRLGRRALTG